MEVIGILVAAIILVIIGGFLAFKYTKPVEAEAKSVLMKAKDLQVKAAVTAGQLETAVEKATSDVVSTVKKDA